MPLHTDCSERHERLLIQYYNSLKDTDLQPLYDGETIIFRGVIKPLQLLW